MILVKNWNTLSTFLPANYGITQKRNAIDSDSLYRLIQVGASYDFANDCKFFSYLSIKHKNCDLIAFLVIRYGRFKFSKIHWAALRINRGCL